MLDKMRTRARSTTVKVLFGLLILVFMFWGVGTGIATLRVHPVAEVNGNRIYGPDLDRQAEQLKRTLGQIYGTNADMVLKNVNLRQEALNQLIEERVIANEARHLGIRISDATLESTIANNSQFQDAGAFDAVKYQQILQANDMLPADYEANLRAAMMTDGLRKMVEQGVQVTDTEARHAYDLRNQKVKLAYLKLPYSDFSGAISPTPKQIEDYYNAHKDAFQEPERIKLDYIHYDPAILSAKISPSDKEIHNFYNTNLKRLYTHPDEVHARHILIEVPSGATDAQKAKAKAKAESILKQLQSGADFAKLAQAESEDPATKTDGGDLGTFGRNVMIKPFEDAIFSMKPGELRLVETKFGFHVVRLESTSPAHVDKLQDVRPKIIQAIRDQAGGRMARQALDEDLKAEIAGASLEDLAKKRGLELIQTPAFSQVDAAGVVHDSKLVGEAFKLHDGDIRAVSGDSNSAPYLVKLVAREAAHTPPLKDIEAKVREAYVRSVAEDQARAKAQGLLKQIKSADDFDKVAQANHLTIIRTDAFARSSETVPDLGSFPEVADAAGSVPKVPGVIDRVMENKGDAYIFEVTERSAPSDDEWKTAQKDFTSEFEQQRRSEAWQQFIQALKTRAKISVDTSQLAQTGGAPLDD